MIEDQETETAASAPTPMDAFSDSEQSGQTGIKKRKLSSWLKEAVDTQSLSCSTPQIPEQMMKKEIEDYIKQPLLDLN